MDLYGPAGFKPNFKSQLANVWPREAMPKIEYYGHHLSHAAAGFQTSPYDDATVVVIDAIGESDTISIWAAEYDKQGRAQYRRLWSQQYPHSIGLFYSAMTQRVGLQPNDEEYITMGMAAFGQPTCRAMITHRLIESNESIRFRDNLHVGVDANFLRPYRDVDIAAGTQAVAERLIYNVMRRAREFNWSSNLVYMGGVALNCVANSCQPSIKVSSEQNKLLFNKSNQLSLYPCRGTINPANLNINLITRLNLNGVDNYFTTPDLNPYLVPVNTSTVISVFTWIYPIANGVIVSEQGNITPPNSNWYDSHIELVNGILKLTVYPQGAVIESPTTIAFNNWYYIGYTYDGTTLRAYINGQLIGSGSFARFTPYNYGDGLPFYYDIGGSCPTSLGNGNYGTFRMGTFEVYNYAISSGAIYNSYITGATKIGRAHV